jgi:hypothetical protein
LKKKIWKTLEVSTGVKNNCGHMNAQKTTERRIGPIIHWDGKCPECASDLWLHAGKSIQIKWHLKTEQCGRPTIDKSGT